MSKQALVEMVKDSPLPAVATLTLAGVSLDKWILVLTAAWAVWRLVDGILSTYWKWKDRKERKPFYDTADTPASQKEKANEAE